MKNVSKNGLVLSRTYFVPLLNVKNKSEEFWKEFGVWLQTAREKAGLTQEQLSKKVSIHVKTISRIENGEATKRQTIEKIANAIGADVDDALRRAGFSSTNQIVEVKNAQEFLAVLQSHGLKIPNFLNGIAGLEQVGEEELNEVLGAMLFQLKLKADKKLLH